MKRNGITDPIVFSRPYPPPPPPSHSAVVKGQAFLGHVAAAAYHPAEGLSTEMLWLHWPQSPVGLTVLARLVALFLA